MDRYRLLNCHTYTLKTNPELSLFIKVWDQNWLSTGLCIPVFRYLLDNSVSPINLAAYLWTVRRNPITWSKPTQKLGVLPVCKLYNEHSQTAPPGDRTQYLLDAKQQWI